MAIPPLKRLLYSPVLPCVALPIDAYLGARYLADGRNLLGAFTTTIAVLLAVHLILRGGKQLRKVAPTATPKA